MWNNLSKINFVILNEFPRKDNFTSNYKLGCFFLERQNDHFIVSIHSDIFLGLQLLVDGF